MKRGVMEIRCPTCHKVLGEWRGDHISISKIGLLVYRAQAMPRKCPRCGGVFDMIKNGDNKPLTE